MRYLLKLKRCFFCSLGRKKVSIFEASLANVEANRASLKKRFARGRVPRFDNLKMESDIASRKPAIEEARKESATSTLK